MTSTETKKPQSWSDKGRAAFRESLNHPGKLPAEYPTQDSHTPKNEADYIAGFKDEQRKHFGASLVDDAGDGQPWLEGY